MCERPGNCVVKFGWPVILSVMIALCGCAGPVEAPIQYDDTLLALVAQKQAEARARLVSFETRYEIESEHREEKHGRHNFQASRQTVWVRKQEGRLRFDASESASGSKQFGPSGTQLGDFQRSFRWCLSIDSDEVSCRRVFNDDDDTLAIWLRASSRDLPQRVEPLVKMCQGVDLADYAFGFKSNLFDSELPSDLETVKKARADWGTFHARKVAGGVSEMIEVVYVRNGVPWMTALVDPSRGYATTQVKSDTGEMEDGRREQFESTIHVEEVADGVWAPVRLTAKDTSKESGGEREDSLQVNVVSTAIDLEFDPGIFRWQSMGYKSGDVHLHDENGETTRMVALGKYLNPAPLMNDADRERAEAYIAQLDK